MADEEGGQKEDKGPGGKRPKDLSELLSALKGLDKKPTGEEETKCKICGTKVPSDSKACPTCGTHFEAEGAVEEARVVSPVSTSVPICPGCGAELDEGFVMCPECGADLAAARPPLFKEQRVLPTVSIDVSDHPFAKVYREGHLEEEGGKEKEEPVRGLAIGDVVVSEKVDEGFLLERPDIWHGPREEAEEEKVEEREEEAKEEVEEEGVEEMVVVEGGEEEAPVEDEVVIERGPGMEEVEEEQEEEPVEMEEEEAETALTNGQLPPAPKLVPPPTRRKSKRRQPKGRRLVSGEGLVDGRSLINGNGMVNGNGMAASRGLVNGSGMVNGAGSGVKKRPTGRRARKRRNILVTAIVAIVVVGMVSVPFIYDMVRPHREEGPVVNGTMGDWPKAVVYEDGADPLAPSADLDIVRYSAAKDGKDLRLYVEVAGTALSGRETADGVDVLNAFIDSDRKDGTGFQVQGIGADHRLQVHGFGGVIKGASHMRFDPSRGNVDWHSWEGAGGLRAAVKGAGIELLVPIADLDITGDDLPIISFHIADSTTSRGDYSEAAFVPGEAAIAIHQTAVCPDVITAGSDDTPVLRLDLEAKGKDVTVESVGLKRWGTATAGDTGDISLVANGAVVSTGAFTGSSDRIFLVLPMTLGPGDPQTVEVRVDVADTSGISFGLGVDEETPMFAGGATISVRPLGGVAMTYLGSPPAGIVIDGAFGDWADVTPVADTVGDVVNPNIDIVEHRSLKETGKVSFYAAVDGTMLAGTTAPLVEIEREPTPSGPERPLPVRAGADTVRVLLDTDGLAVTGCPVHGLGFGADAALVIEGLEGRILSSRLYEWSQANREWVNKGTVDAAKDGTRIEIQVALAKVGLDDTSSFKAHIQASDWTQEDDMSDAVIEIIDPLQLTSDGEVNSSSDGNTWAYETDISSETFVDLTVDTVGNVYALANNGSLYKSTGDWTSWTKIVNSTTDTNFVAVATDSGSPQKFFSLQATGGVYNTTENVNWTLSVDVGPRTDYTDMAYASGTGNFTVLVLVREATADKVKVSSDGGFTWGNLGPRAVGVDAGDVGVTNVAIVNCTNWGEGYNFILQSDGDIRYDKDGTTATPWNSIFRPANDTYADMAFDNNSNLWVVTTQGQTYKFVPNSTVGGGDWSTLGNSSQTNVVAIALEDIPEFGDLVVPILGTVLSVILFRRRMSRRRRMS